MRKGISSKSSKIFKYPIKSIAISAGAGSGKTHALTNKLLLMLLGGIPINEILSITFTNKAAGEIKDRLLKRLKKIINQNDQSLKEFSNSLGINKNDLIEKAKKLYYELIRHFSYLKINTIDSFFTSVLRQFPHETGVGLDIKIADDNERKIIFNDSLEELYRIINSNPKLFGRVYSYLQSKGHLGFKTKANFERVFNNFNSDYFKLIESDIYKPNLIDEAERNFYQIQNYINSNEFEKIINKIIDNIATYLAGNNIYDERNVRRFYNKLKKFLSFKNIYILQKISLFQANDPTDKKYIQKISELRPDLWQDIIKNLHIIKTIINNYVKAKINYQFYRELEIFSLIMDQYSKLKSKKNILDFEDIEILAYKFFKSLKEFNYFRYRMDTPLRYILIDEFQDTSDLQWNAIEPIVEEAIKINGNLIYVGDIKQSIYQWRGGKPELFKRVKAKYGLEEDKLMINYRSAPLVLTFVNSIFADISNKIKDFEYEAQKLPSKSVKESRNEGYILLKAFREYDEIGIALVHHIKKLYEKGVNYDDIAVLCERNDQIAEIESILKMNNIPFVGSGKRSILDNYAVIDILNILRFLSNPVEKIYLASILRSPIFRISYETLLSIIENSGEISLKSLKEYKPEVFNILEKLLTGSRYLPVSKLLLKVFEELSIFEIYPDSRDTILDLYELSYNFERDHTETSLLDFIEFLDKSANNIKSKSTTINGVQLSTIHSAKGLEYHTVIIPYLNSNQDYILDGQYYFKEIDSKGIKGFIKASKEYKNFYLDNDFHTIIEKIKKDYLIEKINLLYVALTRAKNNLAVFPIYNKKTIGGLLLESLYPGLDFNEEPPKEYESGKIVPSEIKEKKYISWENSFSFEKPKIEEYLISPETEEGNQIEGDLLHRRISLLKGLIVHRALSYIRNLPISKNEFDKLIDKAIAYEGKNYTKSERNEAKPIAKLSAKSILEDKRITRFFSKNSYAEVTTLGKEYQNIIGRIDRILLDKDIVEIIDFKTDIVKSNDSIKRLKSTYKKQIISYCKTIKEIFPDREIKGYIYFTDAPYDIRLHRVT